MRDVRLGAEVHVPHEYSNLWRCPELRWPRARVDQLRSGVDELSSHRFGACPRPERVRASGR